MLFLDNNRYRGIFVTRNEFPVLDDCIGLLPDVERRAADAIADRSTRELVLRDRLMLRFLLLSYNTDDDAFRQTTTGLARKPEHILLSEHTLLSENTLPPGVSRLSPGETVRFFEGVRAYLAQYCDRRWRIVSKNAQGRGIPPEVWRLDDDDAVRIDRRPSISHTDRAVMTILPRHSGESVGCDITNKGSVTSGMVALFYTDAEKETANSHGASAAMTDMIWAVKEAGYKCLCRTESFRPREIAVTYRGPIGDSSRGIERFSVRFPGRSAKDALCFVADGCIIALVSATFGLT